MAGATARTCSTATAAHVGRDGVYSVDTPPPTASRHPAHRPRVLLHAHRRQGALRAHARQDRVLPDGLGRQRPAHRAPRAELLRRALRPVAPVRRRLHAAVRGRRQQASRAADQVPISRRNFIELCETLTVEDEKQFEALFRQLGLSVDWTQTYRTISRRDASARASSRSCATSSAARRTRRSRRRCGTSTSAPPSRRPSSRTATSRRAYHRIAFHRPDGRRRVNRDHPPRAAPRLRRARRAPRRRALPAAVRHDRAHPAVRRRGARARAPARPAGQGLGHRDDLHVRRRDRHHLVARARPAEPHDPRARRPRARRRARRDRRRMPAQAAYAELAGKTVFSAKKRDRRAAARVRRPDRRPEALHARREVLREGRPAARDRLDAPVVHRATARATRRCATGSSRSAARSSGTPTSCACATRTGSTASPATGSISRQRFFGVPIPVWYALDDDGERDYDASLVADARPLPVDPTIDVPPGTPRRSAACPAASTASTTSSTPGRPRR